MTQYINKSALVAEIERRMTPECGYTLNKLLDYIDTLEVKEVQEEPTTDYPYAYNPTDIQIKMICNYADKFYGGKFYTEANCLGRVTHTEPYSTYAVRQMDDLKIHEIFGR